jgi:hypothetical protein
MRVFGGLRRSKLMIKVNVESLLVCYTVPTYLSGSVLPEKLFPVEEGSP